MLDFIGIGIGPFNLSLAALLHDRTDITGAFFERKGQFAWHEGMLLPETTLQVPFMADLVSMVEPTNPFSFLNYLKHQDRLYRFYFLEDMHIPRREYNHYCQWVAGQLGRLNFDSEVLSVRAAPGGFEVEVRTAGEVKRLACRNLVLGTGTSPTLPTCLTALAANRPEQCLHSADFLDRMGEHASGDVVVLGSGQSAAETFRYLFARQLDEAGQPRFALNWLTRAQGFFPMEYSPLGLEHFTPAYSRYFFDLPAPRKRELLAGQGLLYKGIDFETIRAIYHDLYHRTVGGASSHVSLSASSELIGARLQGGRIALEFRQIDQGRTFTLSTDKVVAATGYRPTLPRCVEPIEGSLGTDSDGRWVIDRNYRVEHAGPGSIFVQNAELHSHGIGAPDLGLGAQRAGFIANQLLGFPAFTLQSGEGFQRFGAPDTHLPSTDVGSSAHQRRA